MSACCPILSYRCPIEGLAQPPINIGFVLSVPSVLSISTLEKTDKYNSRKFMRLIKRTEKQPDRRDRLDRPNNDRRFNNTPHRTSDWTDGTSAPAHTDKHSVITRTNDRQYQSFIIIRYNLGPYLRFAEWVALSATYHSLKKIVEPFRFALGASRHG